MVQQDIRAARRVGAGIIADDRVKAKGGLYCFAFEPAIQEAARRFGEQFQHITLLRQVELHQPASLHGGIDKGLYTIADIGWGAQRKIAQDVRDPFQHVIILRQDRRVMF